jgi:hypothetical protein
MQSNDMACMLEILFPPICLLLLLFQCVHNNHALDRSVIESPPSRVPVSSVHHPINTTRMCPHIRLALVLPCVSGATSGRETETDSNSREDEDFEHVDGVMSEIV